jgi:hypothetical protein
MGDCSPAQTAMMELIKAWVGEQGFDPHGEYDDYNILRFCRARKFVEDDIKLMMTNYFEWRKAEQVDAIITDFDYAEID